MNLEQIAQQAMDYLDSVGVAADWEVSLIYGTIEVLYIRTDDLTFHSKGLEDANSLVRCIKEFYPQKSPD